MRLAVVLAASFAALSLVPADSHAQRRGRDRDRDRDWDRDHDRRERVRVRVFRDRYREPTPRRDLTLAVGVLNYDFAGLEDDNFPMAALRANWRLTRHLLSELEATYALGDVADATASDGERSTSLATGTVGIQAQLPFRYLRPYVGAAVGLFGRFDGGDDGESSVRPTTAFPVGVRLAVSPRLAVRAEVRWRFDQHEPNTTAVNREQTVGLSFGF